MYTVFEWDEAKAEINRRKHNVRFEEAATVFHDPFIANMPDPDHSIAAEERMIAIGHSVNGQLLIVVYVEREGESA